MKSAMAILIVLGGMRIVSATTVAPQTYYYPVNCVVSNPVDTTDPNRTKLMDGDNGTALVNWVKFYYSNAGRAMIVFDFGATQHITTVRIRSCYSGGNKPSYLPAGIQGPLESWISASDDNSTFGNEIHTILTPLTGLQTYDIYVDLTGRFLKLDLTNGTFGLLMYLAEVTFIYEEKTNPSYSYPVSCVVTAPIDTADPNTTKLMDGDRGTALGSWVQFYQGYPYYNGRAEIIIDIGRRSTHFTGVWFYACYSGGNKPAYLVSNQGPSESWISVSNDNITYGPATHTSHPILTGLQTVYVPVDLTGRFLKVVCTNNTTGWPMYLSEIAFSSGTAATPDNLFLNPRFSQLNGSNLPDNWTTWGPNITWSVDTSTYTILPFNPRNTFRAVTTTANGYRSFGQWVDITGGGTYLFSMTHKESADLTNGPAVVIGQYRQGSLIANNYLALGITYGPQWSVWSKVVTVDPTADEVAVSFDPYGIGTHWFSEVTLTSVPVPTPTGPVAPLNSDNITWTGTGDNMSTWSHDNLTVSSIDNCCLATLSNGTYGCLAANVYVDKSHAPFLTLQVQSQDNQTGGFAVYVDNCSVDLMSYNDEVGSPNLEPRNVPGIISYDLRKFSGIRDNTTVPLKIYVTGAAGSSKQVKFRWIKMANRPLPVTLDFYPTLDYMVFRRPVFSRNDYSTRPTRDEVDNNTVAVSMCRNQIDSSSFCVYARNALSAVTVTAGNLTGPGTIPAAAIDIKAVKVWYQANYTWLNKSTRQLVPELLLKNDALITVNRNLDNQTNILNFTGLPADSDTLQPVGIEAGTTKEFWLTIRPPDNIPAGTYSGTITVAASGKNPSQVQVPVSVTILPFDLRASERTANMYENHLLTEPFVTDMADHGLTSIVLPIHLYVGETQISSDNYSYNFTNLTPVIDRLVSHGVSSPIILGPAWLTSINGIYDTSNQTLDQVKQGLTLQQTHIFNSFLDQLKAYRTAHGYPEFYVYLVDEPESTGDDGTVKKYVRSRQLLELLHGKGLKGSDEFKTLQTANDFQHPYTNQYGTWNATLDYPIYGDGNIIVPIVNGISQPEHSGLVFTSNTNECPTYNRALFGLYTWYSGMPGFSSFQYLGDSNSSAYDIDEFSPPDYLGNRYEGYVYPAQGGKVIDTIESESVLAAVNDLRYLSTLKFCLTQTNGLTGGNFAQLRAAGQSLLNNTPAFLLDNLTLRQIANLVPPETFNNYRQKIIDNITPWVQTPLASDGSLSLDAGGSASGTLVGMYLGCNGNSLAYHVVANGTNGYVSIDNSTTGTYHYTPNPGKFGTDTFTFYCSAGNANSRIATIHVTINLTSRDLAIVLAAMDKVLGETGFDAQADLDGDGEITSTDLSIVLEHMN